MRPKCYLSSANLILIAASLAIGIAFFGPFWLANVDPHEDAGKGVAYFLYEHNPPTGLPTNDSYHTRGLWGQCGRKCQSFWENGYSLQKGLFTPLRWHIATQVLYFIGSALILITLLTSQVQICCRERTWVIRCIGGTLLLSFCLQTAAVAVFGGGAWKEYEAVSSPILGVDDWNAKRQGGFDVYYDWCFWMAVAGGALTLLAGTLYLVYDCILARQYYK